MNRRKLIYFLSAFVLIIGCYALNLSYSLFTQNISSENDVVNSSIPVLNAYLENDSFSIPANSSRVINLKIINSGTADINYGISVSDTKGTTIQLVESFDLMGTLNASDDMKQNFKEILLYVVNPSSYDITDLKFNLTSKYSTQSFNVEDFISTSNIDYINKIKLLSNEIIERAKNINENDNKINGYAKLSDSLITNIGKEVNLSEESLLLATTDDFTEETGKYSYYYRGNINDNYVNFAGMCWRIVRIAGDGSIKLVLEDQDEMCSTSMNGNWNMYFSDENNIGNFGYMNKNNDNTYVNYLNLDSLSENYENSMAFVLKQFQIEKLSNNLHKLKSGDWCFNDKAYAGSNEYLENALNLTENEKYSEDISKSYYYDSYIRLSKDINKPLLMCNGIKLEKWLDDTPMYVGTLTADEIVYAGAIFDKIENLSLYLLNNFQKEQNFTWWTLSLGFFNVNIGGEESFALNSMGYLETFPIENNYSVRPAISIDSNSVILGGIGTIEEPYLIG